MTTALTKNRIASIDILRGLIMMIMALDHVRDFFHATALTADPLNLETTTTALFFTRWITHFCAPTFVFLSGLSAALAARKKTKSEAAVFLIKRGLWLIIAEVAIISLILTFNPLYNMIFFQVIWAIGCSMVILGALLYLGDKAILITGILLVAGHNIFNHISFGQDNPLLKIFLTSRGYAMPIGNGHSLAFLYAVLPWTGVMLLGYSAAKWYINFDAAKRKAALLYSGIGVIALFIVLRLINNYGDETPYVQQASSFRSFLSFINTNKYPPSLQFLCMTIGPGLIFLSFTENINNWFGKICTVYGKVPFFYFVVHFFIIHVLLVIVFFATGHSTNEIAQVPFFFRPPLFGFSLGIVYLIWISLVVLLYKPCQWFARYKDANKQKWWIHYL
jgi:uncharacterized membrane protein